MVASSPSACLRAAQARTELHIRPYRQGDLPAISRIFMETSLLLDEDPSFRFRWEAISRECVATDLANIPGVYIAPGGNFWVATTSEDAVVGMVALQRRSESEAEVKRVSVDVAHHRKGIGRLLMAHLEAWARTNGITTLHLSTGAKSRSSLAFYASLGYETLPTLTSSPPTLFKDPDYFELRSLVKKL